MHQSRLTEQRIIGGLKQPPPGSRVGDVASEWGYANLGLFAARRALASRWSTGLRVGKRLFQ